MKRASPKKTIKSTKAEVDYSKHPFDFYTEMGSFRDIPVSDAWITKLAYELVEWAINDDDALKLTQFYEKRRVCATDMDRWEKRNENLRKAHEFALMVIGNRREIGAIKRKFDASMITSTMAHYCRVWKEMAEWKSKLAKNAELTNQPTIVVLEKMPESEDVPLRRIEEVA